MSSCFRFSGFAGSRRVLMSLFGRMELNCQCVEWRVGISEVHTNIWRYLDVVHLGVLTLSLLVIRTGSYYEARLASLDWIGFWAVG